jgi:cell wall-associated NlpC family hydrolase
LREDRNSARAIRCHIEAHRGRVESEAVMRGIALGALAFIAIGVGLAGVLYAQHIFPPVAQLEVKTQPDQVARAKITTAAADAPAPATTNAIAHDVAATGRPDGAAEWHLIDSSGNAVLCAISPTRRYYVTTNAIGRTEHNEPSDTEWKAVGCENAAPVHQAEIIAKQNAWNNCSALVQNKYGIEHHFSEDLDDPVELRALKTAEFASCGAWPNTASAPWPPDLTKEESDKSTTAGSDAKDAVSPDANSGATAPTPNSEAATDGSPSPDPH